MYTDEIVIIDKKIDELINDKTIYTFDNLKQKVEMILDGKQIFMIEEVLDSKVVDFYLTKVISKRNEIQKKYEKSKIDNSSEAKYVLIETICQKCEFENQEELIKKIEELEKKTNFELKQLCESNF